LLTGLLAASVPAFSQGILVDPMRPADARETPTRPRTGSAPTPPGPGVQVILTSPERKLAVIDGRVVAMGSDANAGAGLSMHPGINKKPASGAGSK
jgi:hypothetical protein